MSSWIAPRSGGRQRHAFGFDRIMAHPDRHRFRDWYARTGLLAPGRTELEATLGRPGPDHDAA